MGLSDERDVSRRRIDPRRRASCRSAGHSRSAAFAYGNRAGVEHALAERGLRRQGIAEIADVLAIPGYVAIGMGVAVLPDIIDPVGCAKLALAEPIPPWTVTLATLPNATERPAVAALIEELRSHTRQQHRERMRAQDPHPR